MPVDTTTAAAERHAPATSGPGARTETIGGFLLRRLEEIGLAHVFGVAGDFNLELLEQMEGVPGLSWVGCCNELNAAYAADGHARTGGLAALVTTYGVGELSALCGVAGAFAEHLPVVSICGSPPLAQVRRRGLLHHTAGDGDYADMMACGREFSIAQARLDPQNAVAEIDRCLRACVLQKRPVYLQLPSDLAGLLIETPDAPLVVECASDARMLDAFVRAATRAIDGTAEAATGGATGEATGGATDAAASVTLLVDADVARFGQSAATVRLADRLGCAVAVMGTAKGAIDEAEAAFAGVYAGAGSRPEVREAVEGAECLVRMGVRFVDSTTGSFSQRIAPRRSIEIEAWSARVDDEDFFGVAMGDAVNALTASVRARTRPRAAPAAAAAMPERPERLSQAWFWSRMGSFLREGDVVVAENGTSLSGIAGTALPRGASVISQALWGAIGYSLPATFGSLLAAPRRRHVLFIGDGSFQLTVQELSSILRHRLKPVIFLINNDGYTIERLILGERSSYNDIQPWRYSALCEVFAGDAPFDSRRVSTCDELEAALEAAVEAEGADDACRFIEVVMERMDAPESLRRLGPVYARQDYGSAWSASA